MPHPLSHGIDTYFAESAAHSRRLSTLLLAVSLGCLVLLAVAGRRITSSVLEDPMRFGFEGPEQWVQRIRLEELAAQESPGAHTVTYLALSTRKGGRTRDPRSPHPQAVPEVSTQGGEGESEQDLLARARMLALEGPVIRSEDLIIERLVRPEYPEEARAQNIEGIVELLALVDTTGSVLQIQIVGGTREPLLERSAAAAILECRYRPYRVADHTRRVWAAYRIAFSLY